MAGIVVGRRASGSCRAGWSFMNMPSFRYLPYAHTQYARLRFLGHYLGAGIINSHAREHLCTYHDSVIRTKNQGRSKVITTQNLVYKTQTIKNAAIRQQHCHKHNPRSISSNYCNMAICSFFLLSVSLFNFLKKALFPPFSSLFLLLFRSIYAIVLPPESSLSLPFVRLFPPLRRAL